MPQKLEELEIREVSLVDAPANSSIDEETGIKVPRAVVSLWKRDSSDDNMTKEEISELEKAVNGRTQGGTTYPASDYAYTPDKEHPSTWKLRLTSSPGGKPDAGIVGAAIAALGKGFRGNKVEIPSSDLPAVKARVRSAWKQANPDRDISEMPEVLKGEVMTLEQIEKRVTEQDAILKALTTENEVLKKERELVLKMSKEQRKAYAAMSDTQQKEFMAADEDKRKKMCDTVAGALREKAAEDGMGEAVKAEYAKAGPIRRAQMLAEELAKSKSKARGDDDNEDEEDRSANSGGDDEEEEDLKLRKRETEIRKREAENADLVIMRKNVADATDRINKAEAALAEVHKRERLVYFTKRAETELPNTSGSPVEKGTHLMTVADSLPGGENGEVFKTYLDNLKAADKALTIHFGEVGKVGGPIPAEKALNAKADEIAKRDKIDVSHAMAKAFSENPELYIAYEQQHRAAVHAQ
jgi:hypothetical protein